MATTEQIRIADTTEAERNLISFLTPEERRDALVREGRAKQHRNDEQLARDQLERILERIRTRQLAPVGIDAHGTPYATNGKVFYYPDENVPMTSLGRVPGRENMHVLQKEDGSFAFIDADGLRDVPTEQERFDNLQFRGELDRIRERKPRLQEP